jgi:hypothetical protein
LLRLFGDILFFGNILVLIDLWFIGYLCMYLTILFMSIVMRFILFVLWLFLWLCLDLHVLNDDVILFIALLLSIRDFNQLGYVEPIHIDNVWIDTTGHRELWVISLFNILSQAGFSHL